MDCGICKIEVNDQTSILCDGFCHSYFHLDCIKMDIETSNAIRSSNQIRWYCPNCNSILDGLKEKSFIDQFQLPVINAINDLKNQFIAFQTLHFDQKPKQIGRSGPAPTVKTPLQKGAGLTPKNPVSKVNDRNAAPNDLNSIKGRLRSNSTNTVNAVSTNNASLKPSGSKQTTPLSSTNRARHSGQESGTLNEPTAPNSSNVRLIDKLVVVPPRSWIFLSRLSPPTTTDDVQASVSDCLCTNDLKVIPLVRKNSQQEPEYISFKIGIPWNLREKALDQSTWPSFLTVREFDNHSNRNRNFLRQRRVASNEG